MINRLFAYLGKHLDRQLLVLVSALFAIGLMTLYSASNASIERVGAQTANLLVALTMMWIAANVPLHYLSRLAFPVYLTGMVLLILVALFGEVVNGARRWLDLGLFRFQPSELMKIAVPLVLAWYFDRYEAVLKVKNFVIGGLLFLIPVLLVARQPDLGTALLITASGFYVLYLAGLSWKFLVGVFLIGSASMPFLWSMLHDYQRRRVLTLLDPTQDPLGAGYHTIQSTIALGSGGLFGKGWLNGTQSHLDFLPERQTDFIFAVFAEEFGLFGNLGLMILFGLLIARGLVIAANAPTLFTRLLAGALTLILFTYVFVNMGMVSGILPIVGVPLPLISYGGTSLVTILFSVGLLMSIHTHRRLVKT